MVGTHVTRVHRSTGGFLDPHSRMRQEDANDGSASTVVVVITNRKHPKFPEVVAAIERELPGSPLWIVRDGRTRGEARDLAIHRAKGAGLAFIVFVDDDFVLRTGWWTTVKTYLENSEVALVWGYNFDATGSRPLWIEWLHKHRRRVGYREFLAQEFKFRGGCHDTVIRLSAWPDWLHIPPSLHYYEDKFILKAIEAMGYRAVVADTGGDHYDTNTYGAREMYRLFHYDRLVNPERLFPLRRMKGVLFTPAAVLFTVMATHQLTQSVRDVVLQRVFYNLVSLIYHADGVDAEMGYEPFSLQVETERLRRELGLDIARYLTECEPMTEYLKEKLAPYRYGTGYGVLTLNEADTLYGLVRVLRPQVIVETGSASGVSSLAMSLAQKANGGGLLVAIDLPQPVFTGAANDPQRHPVSFGKASGWLMTDYPADLNYRIILGDAMLELPKVLKEYGDVGLFFHDSLHTYDHQLFEYEAAWPYTGAIASDDVWANHAFRDFVQRHHAIAVEGRRMGIALRLKR